MKLVLITLKKILFWSYGRGTWQYDIMCVLILAFLFFAPNSLLDDRAATSARSVLVSLEELGPVDPSRLQQRITEHLLQQYGADATVSDVEPVMDITGAIKGYSARVNSSRTTPSD